MTLNNTDPSSFTLDNFEGPLAFLLQLVQKSEIPISNISVSSLIQQYAERLASSDSPDLDSGAEFVSTTASLMWLKSKMLLPIEKEEMEELEEESPFSIIPQLLEYCRFKEISKGLHEREESEQTFYPRGEDPTYAPSKKLQGIEKVSLEQLASLFEKVLRNSATRKGIIREEVWRVSDKINILRHRLKNSKKLPFKQVFSEECCREELIVVFLAVLELMKLQELCIIKEEEGYSIIRPENE